MKLAKDIGYFFKWLRVLIHCAFRLHRTYEITCYTEGPPFEKYYDVFCDDCNYPYNKTKPKKGEMSE